MVITMNLFFCRLCIDGTSRRRCSLTGRFLPAIRWSRCLPVLIHLGRCLYRTHGTYCSGSHPRTFYRPAWCVFLSQSAYRWAIHLRISDHPPSSFFLNHSACLLTSHPRTTVRLRRSFFPFHAAFRSVPHPYIRRRPFVYSSLPRQPLLFSTLEVSMLLDVALFIFYFNFLLLINYIINTSN